MMKDVIITGGRYYANREQLHKVLELFDIGVLIQGGANGADKLALEYAKLNSITNITVSANWDRDGRAAGPIRNKAMVKAYPNAVVIAFPGGVGTENCVKEAINNGLTVLRVL